MHIFTVICKRIPPIEHIGFFLNSDQGVFQLLLKVVCFRSNFKHSFQGVSLMIREGSHVCVNQNQFC